MASRRTLRTRIMDPKVSMKRPWLMLTPVARVGDTERGPGVKPLRMAVAAIAPRN